MKRLNIALFASLLLFAGCDDDSRLSLGSPCDEDSVCEGVCNLGLPGGMCVEACDEGTPCADGAACVDYGSVSYCMPSCASNDECREDYSCIDFACVPRQPLGAACDDADDCLPCDTQELCSDPDDLACTENVCSVRCTDQEQCPEGTVCAASGGEYWCVGVYFPQGTGTAGSLCAAQECAEGFTCLQDLKGFESLAFCSNDCLTDRDCPPSLTCREVDGLESPMCVPREYCESCGISSHCASPADTCVTGTDQEGYCTLSCDPALPGTCPMDTTCGEANLCEGDGSLVANCDQCSAGTCGPLGTPLYACFQDAGLCVGGGNVCDPCLMDSQCSTSAGCVEIPGNGNTICAELCGSANICADGYDCVESGGVEVCVPRTGSCGDPSGDTETCGACQEWSDCLRGGCLPLPSDPSGDRYCLDFCEDSSTCGDHATCETVDFEDTLHTACVPDATAVDCAGWLAL